MRTIITVLPNGPLMVQGECRLRDAQGNTLHSEGETVYLCRCGASDQTPFCDGSHKKTAPEGR